MVKWSGSVFALPGAYMLLIQIILCCESFALLLIVALHLLALTSLCVLFLP